MRIEDDKDLVALLQAASEYKADEKKVQELLSRIDRAELRFQSKFSAKKVDPETLGLAYSL